MFQFKQGSKKDCDDKCDDHAEGWREFLEYRQILLTGTVDQRSIERVVMQIEKFNYEDSEREATEKGYDRRANPITIVIDSGGGYVSSGLAIVAAIEQSETPVVTVALGIAASMAFVILAAGHARYAYRHAHLMYHAVSNGIYGCVETHRDNMDSLDALQERLDGILLERTLLTKRMLDQIKNQKKDWYLFPEQAIELGIIDGIAPKGLVVPKPKRPKKENAKQ